MTDMPDQLHHHLHQSPEQVAQHDELFHRIMSARGGIVGITNPELKATLEGNQDALESVAVGIHIFEGLSLAEQEEVFDGIVDQVFDEDEEAQANLVHIKRARESGTEDDVKGVMARQKKRLDEIRRQVAFTLGVEIDDTTQEDEEYRSKLLARVTGMGDASPEDIMKELGFLVLDKKSGDYKFAMPSDVFPPHITDQWERYANSVQAHVRATAKFNRALEDNPGEIVQLDAIRRYAHNNLANSVKEFLQLEDWNLERCRNFITKMIEQKFPTIETRESQVTSSDVINRLRTINALNGAVAVKNVPEA